MGARGRDRGAEKVLVLGDDTRSFLTIVRSLGRKGITVHAAPVNFRSPALRSRYIAGIHDLPPWLEDGAEWLAAMHSLLRSQRYDLVIPCNETTLLPLQRYRAELDTLSPLAIPDDHAIAVLFDKHATRELAKRVGVPIAAGRLAAAHDLAESVLAEFSGPVVVKPRWSYSLDRLTARGKAEIIGDPARLGRVLSEANPDQIVIERFFSGQGVGISVLASHGRLLQAFEHHRVREIAGASFYRRSAPLTSELYRACGVIASELKYTGIAMFEFKRKSDAEWVLLEVNARPWGSMPLPVTLGVDFPYRWFRLLIAGEETPPVRYKAGVYGRNLIPDLTNSLIEAEIGRLSTFRKTLFMLGRLAELSRFLTARERWDVLVGDDPRPGFIELAEGLRAVHRRAERLIPGRLARRRRRARSKVIELWRDDRKQHILFVCQGNICRSPFAEALLRARIADNTATTASAGMLPHPGRQTPAFGLETAAAHGIDLTAHRSVWLTSQMAESASLIIVFDYANWNAILDRYPNLKTPVTMIGDLAGMGEVLDPIDGSLDTFAKVYAQIATGIAELISLLEQRGLMRSADQLQAAPGKSRSRSEPAKREARH